MLIDSGLNMRNVVSALLPKGPIWRPVPGNDYDNLLYGIADNWRHVQEFLGGLANIRNPYETDQLNDLETEYGIIPEQGATDEERRQLLASIIYAKPGTGSKDDLQTALHEAGFTNLFVYQNDPTIDPAIVVFQFSTIAGNTTAVCGNQAAYCGAYGGELVVNGLLYEQLPAPYLAQCGGGAGYGYAGNQNALCGYFIDTLWRDLIEYSIPTDPNVWRFLFS